MKTCLPWPVTNNWECHLCFGIGSANYYVDGVPTFDKCPICNGGEVTSVCIIPEAEARRLAQLDERLKKFEEAAQRWLDMMDEVIEYDGQIMDWVTERLREAMKK